MRSARAEACLRIRRGKALQLINALRGHLGEFGIVVAQGPANPTAVLGVLADETNDLPDRVREIGQLYLDQIRLLPRRSMG
jgi:transposase